MRATSNRSIIALMVLTPLLLTACKREVAAPRLGAPTMRGFAMAAPSGNPDQHIAISHIFVLELPSAAVEATEQKNLTDCLAAGCTVLSTRIDRLQNSEIQGSISVRIAPDRYPAFASDITAPPATLQSHTETAEDKTVPLLDIEKRLGRSLFPTPPTTFPPRTGTGISGTVGGFIRAMGELGISPSSSSHLNRATSAR